MRKITILTLLLLKINTSYADVEWVCIDKYSNTSPCYTWRMAVPHGWVIATDDRNTYKGGYSTVFVPDENHEWKV